MSSTYSLWFIPLCLLAGALYAFLLYGGRKGFAYPAKIRRLLFLLRGVTVALLCFLLLRPVVEGRVKDVEKPIIVFGIDNSESIVLTKDSAFYRKGYGDLLHRLTERLSKDYQVETYLIGDSVRRGDVIDFRDKGTNLARFFSQVEQRYVNRNVGAVVCLSDGICTEGEDPLYTARRLKQPVYTVALGDTSEVCDLRIAKTNYNRSVYRGNSFPLEILVQANRLKGKQSRLRVTEKNRVVFEKEIPIRRNDPSEWVRLQLQAGESGHIHYKIRLDPVEGECTETNNTADVLIQVLDEGHRVAVIYRAPHPDVAALAEAVRDNPMFNLESFPVGQFRPGEKNYDLYVLHQLPTTAQPLRQIWDQARKSGAGLLLFTGDFNGGEVRLPAECGLQTSLDKKLKNDVYPQLNADFSDFSLPTGFTRMLPDFPPLQLNFGTYSLTGSSSVCLYQKINSISTHYPLLYLQNAPQGKTALFLGEGWWRWRIHNYLHDGDHLVFDQLITQVFQFLVTKEDKSRFRVKGKNLFGENESIRFDAEVYNRNYEPDNRNEVSMQVVSESDKKTHEYLFSKNMQAYQLDIGRLPAGEYSWNASTEIQGKRETRSGRFYVQAVRNEALNLTADHQLLLNIAAINGGRLFHPSSMMELEKAIRNNENVKPIARYSYRHHPLPDHAAILALIVMLLGGEWFLRKWSGNY
ncbi:MAG: VWA domain-containing protein [Bacteroidales bacterium]|nr:VWA domain-containing protein [Bacteroidales bacterium]